MGTVLLVALRTQHPEGTESLALANLPHPEHMHTQSALPSYRIFSYFSFNLRGDRQGRDCNYPVQ